MSPYVSVVILWLLSAIIVGAMVSLNTLLGPRATNPVKREPFECGNAPTGPAWRRFSVRFYMTAILFILFDVEVVFLYPWAVILRQLKMFGFWEMLVYIGVVLVGFFYIWKKGVLDWSITSPRRGEV